MRTSSVWLLAAVALCAAGTVFSSLNALAQDAGHAAHAPSGTLADGEVRKVDRDARKITLRHGPLPALNMPEPMTMVYGIKDPALLEGIKPGDRIRFLAENVGGRYMVIRIEPAN